jgi:hypothetical protein
MTDCVYAGPAEQRRHARMGKLMTGSTTDLALIAEKQIPLTGHVLFQPEAVL